MGKVFYFDTETTGVDDSRAAVVQLSGIIEINGKPVEELNIFMKPFDGADISAEALSVNRMTMEQVMGFPKWEAGMKKLMGILDNYVDPYDKRDKFVICGYRVDFDIGFLRACFRRLGGTHAKYGFGSRFFNASIDVASLVAIMVLEKGWRLANYKLSTVCEYLKVPLDAHDAIEDIRATRTVYRKLAGELSGSDSKVVSLNVTSQHQHLSTMPVNTKSTAQIKLF